MVVKVTDADSDHLHVHLLDILGKHLLSLTLTTTPTLNHEDWSYRFQHVRTIADIIYIHKETALTPHCYVRRLRHCVQIRDSGQSTLIH